MGNQVYTAHGNGLTLIIMDDPLAFPTLAAWDGSTGNILFLQDLSDKSSENTAKVNQQVYRSNDKNIYAIDASEVTGETKARILKQDMLTNTFMWNAVLAAIQAGKKVLEIYNMGYKYGKWQESVKLGNVVPQRSAIAGDEAPLEYMFQATPQQSAFTLSSTNVTAIKAVSGYPSGLIHFAGPHVIAANQPEIIVYT